MKSFLSIEKNIWEKLRKVTLPHEATTVKAHVPSTTSSWWLCSLAGVAGRHHVPSLQQGSMLLFGGLPLSPSTDISSPFLPLWQDES